MSPAYYNPAELLYIAHQDTAHCCSSTLAGCAYTSPFVTCLRRPSGHDGSGDRKGTLSQVSDGFCCVLPAKE